MSELTESCMLCGKADLIQNLGLWFVKEARRPVHLECWLVAYAAEPFRQPA